MIVRTTKPQDVAQMAEILNAIIALGGTTAHETPMTMDEVSEHFVDGSTVLSSVVALDAGQAIGWQSVGWWHGDPHIGSFVRPGIQAAGVGRALFAKTCEVLPASGTDFIIAWIRADNVPGLAYYARIGFRDIGQDPDFALQDGRKVGRIHRRFDFAPVAFEPER
jgi:L-amino acid N-acyltransferase YncA